MAEETEPKKEETTPAPAAEAAAPASEGAAAGEGGAPAQSEQPQQTQQSPQGQQGQQGRGGRGGRDGGGRRSFKPKRERERDEGGVESSLVRIYRCSKVVKGGRKFSFGALVVAGDRAGNIGLGYGKANEVPNAVEKATKDARKAMFKIPLKGGTIPHTIKGSSGSSGVTLVPARPGTGVKAGKSVRPCLELAGITDVLTKAYGSTSPKNLVKATMVALKALQSKQQVEQVRGVSLAKGAGELISAK